MEVGAGDKGWGTFGWAKGAAGASSILKNFLLELAGVLMNALFFP